MSETPINITIEELHIHVDEIPNVQAHDEAMAVNSVGAESTEHLRGPRGTYDIKNRPIRGLILEQLDDSDGATSSALAEILGAKKSTVYSTVYELRAEYGAISRLKENGRNYYRITETGKRILAKYRQQWKRGNRMLPDNFLEGFRKSEV